MESNFLQDCLKDQSTIYHVNDYIDMWHNGHSKLPLHEYLGLTMEEYNLFVDKENNLTEIIRKYRINGNIK